MSAGCVRLQNFYGVADWILAGQDGLSGAALQDRVAAGQQTTVRLKQPVSCALHLSDGMGRQRCLAFPERSYNRDASAVRER